MKTKKLIRAALSFTALSFMLFSACKKDRIPQDDFQDMDPFYTAHEEEEQIIQVDSGMGPCYVTAKKGTRICMTRDMLRDANGNDIPSYPFQLRVIELYSIRDMILRRQPSVSGSNILETSAEVRVHPYKDATEAFIKSGRKYFMETANLPSTTSGMQVYYGYDNGGASDWTNSISTFIPGFVDTLSAVTATPSYYHLDVATKGYASAAKVHVSGAPYTTITLTVAGTNTQNIQAYLSFAGYKSVMRISNLVSLPVPEGETVTLVAFGKIQTGDFVLHQQTFTITTGLAIALNMQSISEANLLAALDAL